MPGCNQRGYPIDEPVGKRRGKVEPALCYFLKYASIIFLFGVDLSKILSQFRTSVFIFFTDILVKVFLKVFLDGTVIMVINNLRIGGLATGIDTDSIVSKLMKAKRIPVDKLKQDKQILQWQQEDYRAVNTSLRSFMDKVFNMKLQATYLAKTAASSNEAAVGVAANSNAVPGIYSVTVTQLAQGVSKGSQAALPDEANADGTTKTLAQQFGLSGSISFTLEGSKGSKAFTFDTANATINNVVADINGADLGISASYDATLNRFFLTTSSTGAAAKIKVTSDSNNFLTGPLEDGSDNVLKLKMKLNIDYTGQDAKFDFGDAKGLTSATNTVTVNGITLTLKQGGGATADITVRNDTNAVFNSIKDFVTAYNDIVDKINSKLSETGYRDYLPLTGEQRDKMSEDQIKKWEEKAKSGLLRNDTLLEGVVMKMRTTMSAVVPGLTGGKGYDNLAKIGINTGLYFEKGKLYIDETKLKDALQKDPDGVMNLFIKNSDVYSEKGIAQRLYDDVNNGMSLISAKAGSDSTYSTVDNSTIGKRLIQVNEDIDKLEDRLKEIEDRYWRQFTAMEQAIQQMNAQSAWLAQQSAGQSK